MLWGDIAAFNHAWKEAARCSYHYVLPLIRQQVLFLPTLEFLLLLGFAMVTSGKKIFSCII